MPRALVRSTVARISFRSPNLKHNSLNEKLASLKFYWSSRKKMQTFGDIYQRSSVIHGLLGWQWRNENAIKILFKRHNLGWWNGPKRETTHSERRWARSSRWCKACFKQTRAVARDLWLSADRSVRVTSFHSALRRLLFQFRIPPRIFIMSKATL